MSDTAVQSSPRAQWIDAARAICVLAIVLMHFQIWVIDPYVGSSPDVSAWKFLISQLNGFRLPLLFIVCGYLVSNRVRKGWSRKNWMSAVRSYYIYVVWLAVYWAFTAIIPTRTPLGVPSWSSFVGQLLLPRSVLWFILALAIYVLVMSAASKLAPAAALTILAALSVSTVWLPGVEGADLYRRVVYYALFFGVGVYARQAVSWFVSGRIRWKLAVAVGGYVLVVLVGRSEIALSPVALVVIRLLREFAASFAVLAIVVILCRSQFLARPVAAIGRLTLPIYVLQMPLLWVFLMYPDWSGLLQSPALRALMPLVGLTAITIVSLGTYWLAMRTPLRWLFEMPRRKVKEPEARWGRPPR